MSKHDTNAENLNIVLQNVLIAFMEAGGSPYTIMESLDYMMNMTRETIEIAELINRNNIPVASIVVDA